MSPHGNKELYDEEGGKPGGPSGVGTRRNEEVVTTTTEAGSYHHCGRQHPGWALEES